jgi:hypothetical protein
MAKSAKPASKPTNTTASTAPVAPAVDYVARPAALDVEMGSSSVPKIFWGLAALGLVVLLWLSLGSGINADDKFQNDYSTKLVNYYGTFGADTTALYVKDGNMHLYGGMFEVLSGFTNKAIGATPNDLSYHNVRHMWSAFFGWLAMLCAALLARHLAGWRAGIITFIIMLLSPRFVGDSMMNPKDIPFAAGYIMALYNMVRVLDTMPRPNRWHLAGLAGGLAIGLATRAGGLLPFAYLGMFAGLHFLLKYGGLRAFGNTYAIGRYAAMVGGIALSGYVLAILFWPYALQSPLKNPFVALQEFSALEVKIRVLYDGINIKSDQTPWQYPITWILKTIPMAVLPAAALCTVGFVAFFAMAAAAFVAPRLVNYKRFWYAMVAFATAFPVFYVIYKESVIHDGWRHLTFVYPTMAVAAGLFWEELAAYFNDKKMMAYGVLVVGGLLLADAGAFIAANRTMPYVYFNPIAGGTAGALGHYETDYWGVSIRDGLDWMEKQGIINDTMTNQIVIATNMAYSAQKLTHKWGDKVRIRYLKWDRRCDDAWDYALYPTRFIEGATLRTGTWPPDNAIHIVKAGGAPILAVLKDNGKNCALGTASGKINDFNTSINKLNAEVANVPDNDLAWTTLSQSYLGLAQSSPDNPQRADSLLELARVAAEKALAIAPTETDPNNLLGMYWIQKDNTIKAKEQFELAVKRDPENVLAYYYLAVITAQTNAQQALGLLDKAIKIVPNYKPAYELAARIHEQRGDVQQAQKIRQAIQQMR